MEEFFDIVRRIREEIRRTIEEIEEDMERLLIRSKEGVVEPLSYVYESPREILITIDLPLVKRKEDINLEVKEGKLILEAGISRSPVLNVENPFYRRCIYRCYRKIFPLPDDVILEEIRARFVRGVLEIRIPRKTRGFRVSIE